MIFLTKCSQTLVAKSEKSSNFKPSKRVLVCEKSYQTTCWHKVWPLYENNMKYKIWVVKKSAGKIKEFATHCGQGQEFAWCKLVVEIVLESYEVNKIVKDG